jgi:hypothetical protein
VNDADTPLVRAYVDAPARAFHAKHGFAEAVFGVSPAPESEPDVELHLVA